MPGSNQLWEGRIGEAILISTRNWDRDFLTSRRIEIIEFGEPRPPREVPNFETGRDRPSRSFKLYEVSQEKSGFTQFYLIFLTLPNFSQLYPTFPIFFNLKMAAKIEENLGLGIPTLPEFWDGLPYPIPIPICQKVMMAIPNSISTQPDPILVEISSPSRYLAHGWFQQIYRERLDFVQVAQRERQERRIRYPWKTERAWINPMMCRQCVTETEEETINVNIGSRIRDRSCHQRAL